MDISEQDPQLELNASDFQDELDSTVLVRERSRGSKLEQSFSKKTGKVIQETAHTITIVPETSGAPKTLSKRDVAVATTEQKQKLPKSGRRRTTIVKSSTSSSETEELLKRKPLKKKSRQVPEQIAFDFEEESRPPVIDISSTTTGAGEENSEGVKQEGQQARKEGTEQIPQTEQIPLKASTSLKVDRKGPTRVLERRRVPTRRYGIDVISKVDDKKNESDLK